MGGRKAPALHVPAPTGALVEIAIPRLIGRLSFTAALAGQLLKFKVLDNWGAGRRPFRQAAGNSVYSNFLLSLLSIIQLPCVSSTALPALGKAEPILKGDCAG